MDVPLTHLQLGLLAACGAAPGPRARVLDFGCGDGRAVADWRDAGFDAYGCDVDVTPPPDLGARIRPIERDPYRVPFDDGDFDVVVSHQVFEHVLEPAPVLAELARVTRPGGVGLHVFPARYKPVEPHVRVPLATVFRARWWLRAWAAFGVRRDDQRELDARACAAANREYLDRHTRYPTRAELAAEFGAAFDDVRLCGREMLLQGGPGTVRGRLGGLARLLPALGAVYDALGSRVVFVRRAD